MVHSLPRTRAQACRAPMSGLPKESSQALEGSSAITQVMERLMVPCVGIGSIALREAHPAARKTSMAKSAFLFDVMLLLCFLPARTEVDQGYPLAGGCAEEVSPEASRKISWRRSGSAL